MIQTQTPNKSFIVKTWEESFYLKAGALGAFRGFCGLPVEHPFDVLKTRMQANSMIQLKHKQFQSEFQNSSMIKNWSQIYRQFGFFKGIYAGYIPSLVRVMSKQFYRFPMMIYFPEQFKQIYSDDILRQYDGIHKVSAGLVIACIETIIICPLERFKVFLMTKEKMQSSFVKQSIGKTSVNEQENFKNAKQVGRNGGNILRSLYVGMDALFYRQISSWISFLYLDYKVKKEFKSYKGLEINEALSNQDLMICSALIGVGNVLIVQPFDKIKTMKQMQCNERYQQVSIINNFKSIIKQKGIAGLYTGVRPRMLHYIINSVMTCSILEKLELLVINKQY